MRYSSSPDLNWLVLRWAAALALPFLVAIGPDASAQEVTENGALPENRFALLIGNEAYPAPWKLDTPVSDVIAIGARLRQFGFKTTILTDASSADMLLAMDRYRRSLKSAKGLPVGFFYFAGHGFMNQLEEENFVVPVNDHGNMPTLMDESVSVDLMLSLLSHDNGNAAQIVMIDACRSAIGIPSDTRDFVPVGGGFSQISPRGGMALMLSTRPRQLAYDRISSLGQYSPFAKALLEKLEKPGLNTLALMGEVMERTAALTANETPNQIPEVYVSSATQIRLNPGVSIASQGELGRADLSVVVRTDVLSRSASARRLVAVLEAQGFSDMVSEVEPVLADTSFVSKADDLLKQGANRESLSALIDQYENASIRPIKSEPPFYYYATGALLPGTGTGAPDSMNFAPDIVFPVSSERVAIVSQLYGPGGMAGDERTANAADLRGPIPVWRDNFCEKRETKNAACPDGVGHTGVDLVTWTDDGPARNHHAPLVAVEAGTIIRKSPYTNLVLRGESGREWRYFHLNISDKIGVGSKVSAGEELGRISNVLGGQSMTTVHLHLELRINGVTRNPYPALLAAYERKVGPGRMIAEGDRVLSLSFDR